MKLIIVFIVTLYCLQQQVYGNQQTDDPTKPFWATRGRRSSGRHSIKADDDIPDKWEDYNFLPETIDKEVPIPKRDQAQATKSLLQSLLNALSSWDGEVIGKRQIERKRGDPKNQDPNNPFWAARG